jgi:hypothetical protein
MNLQKLIHHLSVPIHPYIRILSTAQQIVMPIGSNVPQLADKNEKSLFTDLITIQTTVLLLALPTLIVG